MWSKSDKEDLKIVWCFPAYELPISVECDCVNRSVTAATATLRPSRAPGVCRPATADPSAVKSAFLFDKRLRCDPISVLQMPRFPVMLFSPLFFPTPLPSPSLYPLTLFQAFFSSFMPLFKGLPGKLLVTLHSLFFFSIIHHCSPLQVYWHTRNTTAPISTPLGTHRPYIYPETGPLMAKCSFYLAQST